MKKTCPQCSKPFQAPPSGRKFCSRQCYDRFQSNKVERICDTCGRTFLIRPSKIAEGGGRFCSLECRGMGWDEPCEACGKIVHRTPSHAKRFEHAFCSRECYWTWRDEHIERNCEQCGEVFSDKPSQMTDKRGKYCSQACYDAARAAQLVTLTCEQCGEPFTLIASHVNSSMYQGRFCSNTCRGIARRLPESARSIYSHEFTEALKKQIRERDGHTCQICGISTSDTYRALDVHHIDYNKTNNHPCNLITLCDSCHTRTNYNRGKWRERLASKIAQIHYSQQLLL